MSNYVTLTESARAHLLSVMHYAGLPLYLSITPKGCGGYSFSLSLNPIDGALEQPLDQCHKLMVDHRSLPWLTDTTIDLVQTPLESKLVFRHPFQQCGCGQSFTSADL